MSIERTLVLIKPPCSHMPPVMVQIFLAYVNSGLKMVATKDIILNHLFDELYGEHRGKDYFEVMEAAYRGEHFTAICFEGEGAIKLVRTINGATNPLRAAEGTLRRRFGNLNPRTDGLTTPHNVVHGSDSSESAAREVKLFFPEL